LSLEKKTKWRPPQNPVKCFWVKMFECNRSDKIFANIRQLWRIRLIFRSQICVICNHSRPCNDVNIFFNTLIRNTFVVNAASVLEPCGLYFFLQDVGAKYLQNSRQQAGKEVQPFMFSLSLSEGSTPSTWRPLPPAATTTWPCMTDRTPWRPYWANSAVRCSHRIYAPLPTSCSLNSGRMPRRAV